VTQSPSCLNGDIPHTPGEKNPQFVNLINRYVGNDRVDAKLQATVLRLPCHFPAMPAIFAARRA
jgi:hypothetical protein